MPKFIDTNNKVYHFDSLEEKERFAKVPMTLISDEEADAIINPPETPKQKKQKVIAKSTAIVKAMVQQVIDDYNDAHNVEFESVDSLNKYTRNSAYPHHQFCSDVLDWVVGTGAVDGLYKVARDVQKDILDGTIPLPTKAEFIAMLPAYSGVK